MSQDQKSQYTFKYSWPTVIKGFWNKYPCNEISFVKWNKVVDLVITPDNNIQIKRIYRIGCIREVQVPLGAEFRAHTCGFQITTMIGKSKMFPNLMGQEMVQYRAENANSTIYEKILQEESSFVMKYASQFNNSFQKGVQVIEQKCREFVSNKHTY